ncbi:hypothetical protein DL95DRAFT_468921 [Leptodontidium sp. 2 PMI_412]|nr:hypothetical protein DL95DRAFT_468921 [Leptodontidium sp. 2 PMI_412]
MYTPMNDRHVVHPTKVKSESKPIVNPMNKIFQHVQVRSSSSKLASKTNLYAASEPEPTLADADEVSTIYFTNPLIPQYTDRYVMGVKARNISVYGSDDPLFERSANPCRPGVIRQSGLAKTKKQILGKLHIRVNKFTTHASAGPSRAPALQASSRSLEGPSTPTTTSDSLLRRSGSMYTFPSLGNQSMHSFDTIFDSAIVDADTPTPSSKTRRYDDIMASSGSGSSDFMGKVLASGSRSVKSMDNLIAENSTFTEYVGGWEDGFPVRMSSPSDAAESTDAIAKQLSDQSFIMRTIEILSEQHPVIATELRVLKNAIQKHEANKEVTKAVDEGTSNIALWEKVMKIRSLEDRLLGKDEQITKIYQHVDDLEIRQEVFEKDLRAARKQIAGLQTEGMMKGDQIRRYEGQMQVKGGQLQAKDGRIHQLRRNKDRLTSKLDVSRKKFNHQARELDSKVRELEKAYLHIEMLEKAEKEAMNDKKAMEKELKVYKEYFFKQNSLSEHYFSHLAEQEAFRGSNVGLNEGQGSREPDGKGKDFRNVLDEVASALRDYYIDYEKRYGKAADVVRGIELLAMIEDIRDNDLNPDFYDGGEVKNMDAVLQDNHGVKEMSSVKEENGFKKETGVKEQIDDDESYRSDSEAEVELSPHAALLKSRRHIRCWNGIYI